ncbi:MAG: site-2 protease family protein [Methanocellales archaeon]|nr:site-2 protease family protein [Methanocellales archaeon]
MNSTLLVLAIFGIYWAIISALDKKGVLERHNIRAHGPLLMIGTKKGQKLLERLAKPRRFWRTFAGAGQPLMLIAMCFMFAVLLYADYLMLVHPIYPSALTEPRNILLLPGINEFIPLIWGLVGLIVAIVVHEFSHAILGKVENIRVKSMGIVLALIPVAFFTELDDEQLFGIKETGEKVKPLATKDERVRILIAGVMANFVIALIAFILFFGPILGAIVPTGNVMVASVTPGSPADLVGIQQGVIITQLDKVEITSIHDVYSFMHSIQPRGPIAVHAVDNGIKKTFNVDVTPQNIIFGVEIMDVIDGYPAKDAGITPGMRIVRINNMPTPTLDLFMTSMNATHPAQTVNVRVIDNGTEKVFNVTLAEPPHEGMKKGFLGVTVAPSVDLLGAKLSEYPAADVLSFLQSIPSMLGTLSGWLILVGLPFMGVMGSKLVGFTFPVIQFYQPVGWALPLGNGIFWIANLVLWVAWINFYVGLFNCLPAVPLDGGHVFREMAISAVSHITKNKDKQERISNVVVNGLALLILASFIFLFIGPYLMHGMHGFI